jgi:ABC-2 type transport system ATP-binding protein
MIEADSLVKHYGAFEAVRGITFRIGTGEVVGLLGPNGAGKTSVMRILTSYHFPTSGSARVASHDVTTEPLLVRRAVGYLPENAPLYQEMKVREYLSFIADARGLGKAERRQRIEWVVETCGLSAVFVREIAKLSRGYRQRVGLAQAILHDPAVLVLDEPTSGLDPNQIVEIRALIRSLGTRKTVILSTHIMQEVEALCRQVLIMNEGKLVAQGTAEEIGRGLARSTVLSMSFKGAIGDEIVRTLAALPGATGIDGIRRPDPGTTEVDLSVSAGSAASEAVYDWAVARGVKILGMRTRTSSLEDLFASLTAGEGGGGA